MHCNSCGNSLITEAYCEPCATEIDEKETALTVEIERLRQELGYIANAKRKSFKDTKEFRTWAQSRARYALKQEAGTLTIKKS